MAEEYAQKSFQFWVSYFDVARDLDDGDRLAFYDAVMAYIFLGEDPEEALKGAADSPSKSVPYFAFKGIKANLKTSKVRAVSGKSGSDTRWSEPDCHNEDESHEEVCHNDEEWQEEICHNDGESHEEVCYMANEWQTDNKEKEKEKVKEKVKGKEKKPYGPALNVMLTDEEHERIIADVKNPNRLIDSLSDYLESTGKRYKSHYATLRSWARRDNQLIEHKPPGGTARCKRMINDDLTCGAMLLTDDSGGLYCPRHGRRYE